MRSPIPIDAERLALGIQQPWIELILRGIKTIEVRALPTRVRGPIYLYASKRMSALPAAGVMLQAHGLTVDDLPRGLLIGSVEVVDSRPCEPSDAAAAGIPAELLVGRHAWVLARPERLPQPVAVDYLPFGVWFYPFQRKGTRPPRRRGG